ncbi:MAG: hypothetical protein A2Z16_02770 [Chloroflexi bacterium RBG_16_54_18]|nr:MAG: hypothetical protein A2Z16_02770 [Chloroflexi bacterium RBG_16_54_18]
MFSIISLLLVFLFVAPYDSLVGVPSGLAYKSAVVPRSAQALTPLTITVMRVDAHCDPEASGQDFFAHGTIDGVDFSSRDHAGDDDNHIQPSWAFTYPVDEGEIALPITLGIKDMDGGWPLINVDPDDRVDIHPDADKTSLSITYNVVNGLWTVDMGAPGPVGDPPPGRMGTFRGSLNPDCAEIEFDIGTGAFGGDRDRDGLLDNWERFGIDSDGDGDIDVDLPAMGADPDRQDIFVEVDWMVQPNAPGAHTHEPLQAAWIPIWHAFDEATVFGWIVDDDGPKLHIDTGNLYLQPGGVAFDCDGDGIGVVGDMDCDNDGIIDIGNLGALGDGTPGGGNALPETQFLDFLGDGTPNDFYTVKANPANFNPLRAPVFHYAIFGHDLNAAQAGTSGRAEIFGNDILVTMGARNSGLLSPYNNLPVRGTQIQQAGTFMHELGHNLNLRHGGGDDENFKPIYISVMNWDHQFGIVGLRQNQGLDYSNIMAIPWFDESDLDECCFNTVIDCKLDSRANVARVWTIGANPALQFSTSSNPDWNGDNFLNPGGGDDGDGCDTPNASVETNFRHSGMQLSILQYHDDWNGGDMRFDFNHSPEYADGAPQEMVVEMTQAQENSIMAARPAVLKLFSPNQFCPSRTLVHFDNLPAGTLVTNQYPGVQFIDNASVDPILRNQAGRGGAVTISQPNSLYGKPQPGPSSAGIPLTMVFTTPMYRVGMYIGNGGTLNSIAALRAYDTSGTLIGEVRGRVPEAVTEFLGVVTLKQKIAAVQLDYPISDAEEIDNLVFDACENIPQPPPTEPTTPFDYFARAEGVAWVRQNEQNVDIVITPLEAVPLTLNGVIHNSPYDGQIDRNSDLNLQAPLVVIDPGGRRLVFHHWRMEEYLNFGNGQLSITVTVDHNATFTAVYYPTQNSYLPIIMRH